ncbi:MAG: MoaD/ThiS family protein [Cyclobacteriaceae bacterium]|nr:MoaD/ThiS family protein [Cyclobacteriaceae bacterium]MDH4297906.1 MoaD/ThiS family protein [Cyclobacteriaceae bacterium]MDH5251559.1 MoaD/ThiS family protein [Cyclobacteriaceae bacterium]
MLGRSAGRTMIRVVLPYHLRNLARVGSEKIQLEVAGTVTVNAVLDALEARYPMLAGTIREHDTKKRRAFVRFFACGEDFTMVAEDKVLPEKISNGEEPFMVVGAIAGG